MPFPEAELAGTCLLFFHGARINYDFFFIVVIHTVYVKCNVTYGYNELSC